VIVLVANRLRTQSQDPAPYFLELPIIILRFINIPCATDSWSKKNWFALRIVICGAPQLTLFFCSTTITSVCNCKGKGRLLVILCLWQGSERLLVPGWLLFPLSCMLLQLNLLFGFVMIIIKMV
jgi:hypothetical protein